MSAEFIICIFIYMIVYDVFDEIKNNSYMDYKKERKCALSCTWQDIFDRICT